MVAGGSQSAAVGGQNTAGAQNTGSPNSAVVAGGSQSAAVGGQNTAGAQNTGSPNSAVVAGGSQSAAVGGQNTAGAQNTGSPNSAVVAGGSQSAAAGAQNSGSPANSAVAAGGSQSAAAGGQNTVAPGGSQSALAGSPNSAVAAGASQSAVAGPPNSAVAAGASQSAAAGMTASNGEMAGTAAPTPQSATPESGIAGYSTQSNGQVLPISAAAGTGSSVSNGQIVPVATGNEASAQSAGPGETAAVAASNAAQSAAAVAASNSAQSAAAVAAGGTQNTAASAPTAAVAPKQQYFGKGPYTQSPVGYDSSTTQLVPTSILHGPTSTPSATEGQPFGPSSLPSNVPQILYQNGGPGSQPPNTRLINIAFRFALNYLFVYNHTVSQQQIFHYIPLGICYGLEIEVDQVTMQSLRAWDTYEDVGYITTLALAWIPEGLVDNLGLLVTTSVSRFYRNPDNSTAFLLSMINSAIPIIGSNSTDGATTPFGNIPTDTSSAKTAGAPIGGDIGNSEHVRASSVGIGVGVACGAAAYGAAMFFVARRYKKRRQSHLRSPSMLSSPVMSHAGPDAGAGAALMSGAMGERSASPYYDNDGRAGSRGSGRSGSSRHQISAPVMAENSLGWN